MAPSQPAPIWQIHPSEPLPAPFLEIVKEYTPGFPGHTIAQLLWQSGIREPAQIASFLKPEHYQPTSPFAFGEEMDSAVQRIFSACDQGEKVAIWGDFDADGITSTAVLWEGLGQFLPPQNLQYVIPNRLRESHGLNCPGLERLATEGITLVITCDTGSTNLAEIESAQSLGIDVIVTDHHTLPTTRPPVIALINPRYFTEDHPLFHLSGVAVAYKLIEALYQTRPQIPQQPLETLLDLVAIGLIADLVQLKGDARYLAQRGIQQLQKHKSQKIRPGVSKLLDLCQRNGDRPMDISFGIGPRINAVSRVQGDASFCVQLLTSRDVKECDRLAHLAEEANQRRKGLQNQVLKDVKKQLESLDLSTTGVIVLVDPQWPTGVLGLVAGQIAQEYGRPTILLSTEGETDFLNENPEKTLARGSARSVQQIDLYQLVQSQSHLLHRFGGHPFAAGLSLPMINLPLFTAAINRQLREQLSVSGDFSGMAPIVEADLTCTVSQLGQDLFQELKLLEPCGMGNPAPKLLIQNCWFDQRWNQKIKDRKGEKIDYIKTDFRIYDHSCESGFPGVWWGHYREEIPDGPCDAILELDFNAYQKEYQGRLIAVRSAMTERMNLTPQKSMDWILDYRSHLSSQTWQGVPGNGIEVNQCPRNWNQWCQLFRQANSTQESLIITYQEVTPKPPLEIWYQLLGIAKYLSRTEERFTKAQLYQKLGISRLTLQSGLEVLKEIGFEILPHQDQQLSLIYQPFPESLEKTSTRLRKFLTLVQEEQFQQQYFSQIPLTTLQGMATYTFREDQQIPPHF